MFRITLSIFTLYQVLSPSVQACSRVFFNENPKFLIVGRNMDWIDAMPVDLYALPRGAKRSGLTGKNTLEWTSKNALS